ncbi:GNAT family N-acetyltransferase [Myroides odoratimimus]|uniref:GNAT family N-acetyltransferase n=1 Tax=Myroides odoratimimus TaxID=76832 RepID=UPI0025781F92|nr:GNAT family N-acetyltransferase [Myroides odoratimimus]MDM1397300.1 GNAT family N-acetyltransferase [Myroides odoratimimus]
MIHIRPAILEDIPQLQLLYQKQFVVMQEYQPDYFKADLPAIDFLEETIQSDEWDFLVAVDQGKLIGMVALFIEQTLPYECFVPHKYLNFADIYVEPEYRSKGIGKQLIDAVKQWAKHRQVDYIELLVVEQNKRAYDLYLKEHFEPVHTVMRYKI